MLWRTQLPLFRSMGSQILQGSRQEVLQAPQPLPISQMRACHRTCHCILPPAEFMMAAQAAAQMQKHMATHSLPHGHLLW